jgi:hypothetical protein
VAGRPPSPAIELFADGVARIRRLAQLRRARLIDDLRSAAGSGARSSGLVAEMPAQPRDGSGGRDANRCRGPDGRWAGRRVARSSTGYLRGGDQPLAA